MTLAVVSGGRKFKVSSSIVLATAFTQIIEELGSDILSHYPGKEGTKKRYLIKVGVYLLIRARKSYVYR